MRNRTCAAFLVNLLIGSLPFQYLLCTTLDQKPLEHSENLIESLSKKLQEEPDQANVMFHLAQAYAERKGTPMKPSVGLKHASTKGGIKKKCGGRCSGSERSITAWVFGPRPFTGTKKLIRNLPIVQSLFIKSPSTTAAPASFISPLLRKTGIGDPCAARKQALLFPGSL